MRSRGLAAQMVAWATPVVASGLVHVLLIGAVLAIGVRATPRWRPIAQAELIVLARDIVPTRAMSMPRAEPQRPVLAPPSAPRLSSPPPQPVTTPVTKPEVPVKAEEALVRRDAVPESGGQGEAGRSGNSLFAAPRPSGEERPGSDRTGPAPSSGGSSSTMDAGAGRGVAALPGQAGSRSGTGISIK